MTKTLNISAVIVALALVILATVILFKPFAQTFASSFPSAPAFNVATTSTAVSVSGVSTRLLATTTNLVGTGYTRAYATICNPSSTVVYLRLDGDKPVVTSQGYPIAAAAGYNVCYEITDDRLKYLGSVQASSSAQAVSVSVTDFVY